MIRLKQSEINPFIFFFFGRSHVFTYRGPLSICPSCGFQSQTNFHEMTKSICSRFTVYEAPKNEYNFKIKIECVTALSCAIHYGRSIYSVSFMTIGVSLHDKEEASFLFPVLFSNTFPFLSNVNRCPRADINFIRWPERNRINTCIRTDTHLY